MTALALFVALMSSVFNAAATLALREAAQGRTVFTMLPTPVGPLSDLYIAAVALYGGAFLTYAVALKFLTPPTAYPIIVGGCYALILAGSWALTRAVPSTPSIFGGVLVMAGIILIATTSKA